VKLFYASFNTHTWFSVKLHYLNLSDSTHTSRGLIPDWCKELFSSPKCPDWVWSPPSLVFNEHQGVLSPGVKQPRHEVYCSPQSSAEVRNNCSHTFPPPYTFMAPTGTSCWG
jgi:hypothetical protein